MLTDVEICAIMCIAEYHNVNGKTMMMSIDESHDSILKCAKGVAREQYIRDMKWIGKHIARQQATFNGEDIVIVVIPLREWQEIGSNYPIYAEMSKKC